MASSFELAKEPCRVKNGNELFQPDHFYHNLVTIQNRDTKITLGSTFVECLDSRIINSRLHYSCEILPWTSIENVVEYVTTKNLYFNIEDPRSHLYIFCRGDVSVAVTMKFMEGDGAVDIQKVYEIDKHKRPLKRLFLEETLGISDSVKINHTDLQ